MNPKNLHLAIAVALTIGKFHSAKLSFSAWDITKDIRTQVNSGALTLKDLTGGGTFGGAPKVEIPHPTVRDIVKELFAEKLLPDYTQHDTGIFIEYRFPNAAPVAAPAPVAAKPRPIQVGDIVTIRDGIAWKKDWDGSKVIRIDTNYVHVESTSPSIKLGTEGALTRREIAKFETPVVLGPKVGRFITLKAHIPFQSWNGTKVIGLLTDQVQVESALKTRAWFYTSEIASYSDAPAITVTPLVVRPTQAVKSAVNQLKTSDAQMWALVDAYIKNRGQRTTLKQIQSRLKGWKVTVREIGSYLKGQTCLYIEAPYYNSWVA